MNKAVKAAIGVTAISAGSFAQCYGYGLGLFSDLPPSSIAAAVAVSSASTSLSHGGVAVYNTVTDEAIEVGPQERDRTIQA